LSDWTVNEAEPRLSLSVGGCQPLMSTPAAHHSWTQPCTINQ